VNGKGAGKLIGEDGNGLGRMDPATVGFGFDGTEEEEIHRGRWRGGDPDRALGRRRSRGGIGVQI
jgi:hypothetical protein